METIEQETVEVAEKDITPESTPMPTRDEKKKEGWTAAELDSAEKRGMIAKPEDTKSKVEAEKPKVEQAAAPADEAKPELPKNILPDFTFKTPEQEKAFLDAFGVGTPHRAMYFRMKNERQARQAAEQERDKERQKAKELEERLKAAEKGPRQEIDEDGNLIDPDEKPMTMKEWKKFQLEQAEAVQKQHEEDQRKRSNLTEAQKTQEQHAREIIPDWDETVNTHTKDILNRIVDGTIEELIIEPWKIAKLKTLVPQLRYAADHADEIPLDAYHAAFVAHEIGTLHPSYGKKVEPTKNGDASDKDGKPKDPKKVNGDLTPEQMKRIEENTLRRASSASIPGGGGKRTISVDDVDLATFNAMGYRERETFRVKHPEQYAKLRRG